MRALTPEDLPRFAAAQRDAAVTSLVRSALATALHAYDRSRGSPEQIARRAWDSDRNIDLILRAATAPAMTTATGWAAELAHVAYAFLDSLRPLSAGADLLKRAINLTFDSAARITLPTLAATPANFVGEAKPIPVQAFSSTAPVLEPRAIKSISVLSREMVEGGNAENLVKMAMTEGAALALDAKLFSADVPTDDAPAGLLYNISALPASAATNKPDALSDDVSALIGAIAAVSGNSNYIFVAAPQQAAAMEFRLARPISNVGASSALSPGTVIAVALQALVAAVDAPRVEGSRETSLHMADPASAIVDVGGVKASPVYSLYQSDNVGLRLIQPISWLLRDSRGVAWIEGTAW